MEEFIDNKINNTVKNHFLNPQNWGNIKNPDYEAEVKSGFCGDTVKFQFKVKNNIIKDVKFKCYGCWAAIAAASITTEILIGKTTEEALLITNEEIIQALGGIPEDKKKCSLLSEQAIKKALGKEKNES